MIAATDALKVVSAHFLANKSRTANAVCGAYCEGWLNVEARTALVTSKPPLLNGTFHLGDEESPKGWSNRPDLTVYADNSGNKGAVVQVVEGKIVAAGPDSRMDAQLLKLRSQLETAHSNGVGAGNAIGLIYLVHVYSRSKFVYFDKFCKHARGRAQTAFSGCQVKWEPSTDVEVVFEKEGGVWGPHKPLVNFGLLVITH